jgi:hypothetical protein
MRAAWQSGCHERSCERRTSTPGPQKIANDTREKSMAPNVFVAAVTAANAQPADKLCLVGETGLLEAALASGGKLNFAMGSFGFATKGAPCPTVSILLSAMEP